MRGSPRAWETGWLARQSNTFAHTWDVRQAPSVIARRDVMRGLPPIIRHMQCAATAGPRR
jgi:hypothetical protein